MDPYKEFFINMDTQRATANSRSQSSPQVPVFIAGDDNVRMLLHFLQANHDRGASDQPLRYVDVNPTNIRVRMLQLSDDVAEATLFDTTSTTHTALTTPSVSIVKDGSEPLHTITITGDPFDGYLAICDNTDRNERTDAIDPNDLSPSAITQEMIDGFSYITLSEEVRVYQKNQRAIEIFMYGAAELKTLDLDYHLEPRYGADLTVDLSSVTMAGNDDEIDVVFEIAVGGADLRIILLEPAKLRRGSPAI